MGKETEQYREFDGEAGDSTGQLTLPPISVPAYTTEDFSLLSDFSELPLPLPYASVRIQYTGPVGGVIAEVASVDESNDLVVDSHVVNEGWSWVGSGANPFHLDNQTESILFLTDMGDKPVRMGFVVTVGGVNQALTQLKLDPHETRAINLRKLRDAQRRDFKGRRIPADATDGTVTWARVDNEPVAGRVAVINRRNGMASNYDCCICPCPIWYVPSYADYSALDICDSATGDVCFQPLYTQIAMTTHEQLYAYAQWSDCNGNYVYSTDVTSDGGTDWWSENEQIATVDGNGYVSTVSAGQTYVDAEYYNGCGDWEGGEYGYWTCTCMSEPAYSTWAGVDVSSCPVPTNFTQAYSNDIGEGRLESFYNWDSTSGYGADLSRCGCKVYERVDYPGYGGSYTWPDPPWYNAIVNPTLYPPNGQPAELSGVGDTQHTGTFLSPSNGAGTPFSAIQHFYYVCTGINYGNPVNFGGPFTISRSVSQNGGTLTYTVTKNGASASCQVGVNCENN
ncbi:MAG: Ig-like domain-containing protein [Acidobacteriota bacterium]|nr:Ig-like domain-containing protein [Acidobacteriota bacterium]